MDLNLENRKALVSGSTAGIGLAIARRLAKEGAEVWINGRTKERVDEALDQFGKEAGNLHGLAADLGTAAGCAEVVRQLPAVDIFINNLGIFEPKPFEKSRMPTGKNSSRSTSSRVCA